VGASVRWPHRPPIAVGPGAPSTHHRSVDVVDRDPRCRRTGAFAGGVPVRCVGALRVCVRSGSCCGAAGSMRVGARRAGLRFGLRAADFVDGPTVGVERTSNAGATPARATCAGASSVVERPERSANSPTPAQVNWQICQRGSPVRDLVPFTDPRQLPPGAVFPPGDLPNQPNSPLPGEVKWAAARSTRPAASHPATVPPPSPPPAQISP